MCKHEHGDTVEGYWLCGQCYKKLDERPREYRMVKGPYDGLGDDEPPKRQEVFLASIVIANGGLKLSEFIDVMARRLMSRLTLMAKSDAISYSIELLEMMGEEYGCDDMDWDTDAAWEIIKDDMQSWDYDGGGGNE